MNRFICQTPQQFCCGGKVETNQFLFPHGFFGKNIAKAHATAREAFQCYGKYLESVGYRKLSPREFQRDGEGILILTKPCRYGGRLRRGKNMDSGGTQGKRFMPASKRKTGRGGLVVG